MRAVWVFQWRKQIFRKKMDEKRQSGDHTPQERMNLDVFSKRSLKTRVTLFTLAIFVAGIWSLAFYASRILREDMQRLLGEQAYSTASMVAADIQNELSDRLNALVRTAARITPATLGNVAAMQTFLEDHLALEVLFNGGAFVTGADGTATASVPLSAERHGVNFMERDHVVAALKEGKSKISKPTIGKALRAPVFGMAVPIRDSQGTVIGALVGVIDLSNPSFLDRITDNKYGKSGGYVLVAPRHQLIVIATDKSRIMQPTPAPRINPLFDRYMQGYEGYGTTTDSLGLVMLSAAKKIPVAEWFLVARMPAEEAFAPILEMQQRVLIAAALLSLLAGALSWWMLRRQLAPIFDAARTLDSWSRSDRHPLPLPITSQDEIGHLIAGFNRLLETIAQRETALAASEERWKFAVEGSGDGVWDWNLETGEAIFSRRWKEMLGWEENEIGNHSDEWVKRVHPDDLAGVMADIQAHLDGNTPAAAVEFRMQTKGGGWKWILGRGVVVRRDAAGKPLRMVGTNADITQRKQAEAARDQLVSQLRESQKMEALGTLAGGVAHDFNNALAAILGNVELARQDVGPAHEALVSLEEIAKASRRAKDLVQQILSFGRRQKLERKVTSLGLVVVETARLLRATLPAMVSLNVNCEGDTPAVLADATQIKQVLLNLCTNALQAVQDQGRPGVVDVRLDAWVQAQGEEPGAVRPRRYARLTVRDNGPGMDEATRTRIFEPFFTTKPAGKGTGLGLSVVHGIVLAHEANIEVESIPGEGSAFRIYFPAAEALVAEVTPPTDAAPVQGKGKHVLYLDDEEAIIFLMKRLLERQGYRVSGYTEPRKALAAVAADPGQFDLAVTDYYMPGMSGLEVAQALKAIRPDLPVVMASGYITEELRAKAPAAGISELIYKPNTVEDLCEAVARFANASGKA